MKRFFVYLCVFLVLFAFNSIQARAVDSEEIFAQSGADELIEKQQLDIGDRILQIIKSAWDGFAGEAVKYCGIILACLIILAVAENVKSLRENSAGNAGFDFVSAVALSAASFPALQIAFNYAKSAIEGLVAFCASLLPVMTALYSMGGNTAQGVASASGLGIFLTVTEAVCGKLLLPLLSLGFAFAITGLLPGHSSLAPLASFVKTASCVLIAFVFSLVCFVFYFQTAVAATSDNFTYRTVKFASGTFIPVIGNAVGESARTVFGAVSAVKGSVGGWGLAVMLGYLLPPVISGFLYKLCFSFCSVSARLFGLEKASKFLGELSGLLGISLALLIACAVVFTVISAVFLKSGVAL